MTKRKYPFSYKIGHSIKIEHLVPSPGFRREITEYAELQTLIDGGTGWQVEIWYLEPQDFGWGPMSQTPILKQADPNSGYWVFWNKGQFVDVWLRFDRPFKTLHEALDLAGRFIERSPKIDLFIG